MKQKLGTIGPEIASGLHPSLPDDKVPLWKDGEDVVFEDGAVRPRLFQTALVAAKEPGPTSGLLEVLLDGVPSLFWGTATKLWMFQQGDSAPTEVGSGYTSNTWSTTNYGNIVVATNGVDPPQVYGDPSSPNAFIDLHSISTGLDPNETWKLVRSLGAFLFGFGLDSNSRALRWASEDSYIDWGPSASNSAGDLPLRTLESDILAVESLLGGFGVYGKNQLYAVQYVGGNLVFGQSFLLNDVGVFGPECISVVGRFNYGVGPHGIFRTDGTSVEFIDKDSFHDYFFENLNINEAHKIASWQNPKTSTVYWSFPFRPASQNTYTIGFDWLRAAFMKHNYGRASAQSKGLFGSPVMLSQNGSVFVEFQAGSAVEGEGDPLTLTGSGTISSGYGHLGYGESNYGGKLSF